FFVRLTQRLVRLLQEHTVDGYVFRTDLRLRPDPGSTAVAISTAAALQYYESRGQNWERAALIKARPVAGDRAAGRASWPSSAPMSGGNISISRRSPTSIRSNARFTIIAVMARSRWPGTISSSAGAA